MDSDYKLVSVFNTSTGDDTARSSLDTNDKVAFVLTNDPRTPDLGYRMIVKKQTDADNLKSLDIFMYIFISPLHFFLLNMNIPILQQNSLAMFSGCAGY